MKADIFQDVLELEKGTKLLNATRTRMGKEQRETVIPPEVCCCIPDHNYVEMLILDRNQRLKKLSARELNRCSESQAELKSLMIQGLSVSARRSSPGLPSGVITCASLGWPDPLNCVARIFRGAEDTQLELLELE